MEPAFNFRRLALSLAIATLSGLSGTCADASNETAVTKALRNRVSTIVVIYAENRSFDNLYGLFAGANGIPGVNPSSSGAYIAQTDRDVAGTPLKTLPPVWKGVTLAGHKPVVTQAQSANLPNAPFRIESAFGIPLPISVPTRDLVHRFYESQMQIDGGRNDKFVAYGDSGALVMGYYDGSAMLLWKLAHQYTLADNFFMGAFGGSFLNHQYLICACAPEYPHADSVPAHPSITVLDKDGQGNNLPRLALAADAPASAMDGPPDFAGNGNLTPANYFGDGKFYAVNTMQPPYQPSGNPPAKADSKRLYADPARPTTLPPQTQTTIGDLLDAKKITWAWYSGAWKEASKDFTLIYNKTSPNFQAHHQPFNYYAVFDPVIRAAARKAHLKDYDDLVADIHHGTLPAVVFYKPEGDLNQHSGYASVQQGDSHIADVIANLQASPQWKNMVIVVTYDENGGYWDHVAPPKGDRLGPGLRVPALIISPFSKMGTVDHTQYDTGSIARLIERRFALPALPGLVRRDEALKNNGAPTMGDLTEALDLLPGSTRGRHEPVTGTQP
jgi:acid phosphatase